MIDFKLTKNGDIDIAAAYQFPIFNIKFFIKEYPCLLMNFDTKVLKVMPRNNRFKIDFKTNIKKTDSNVSTVSIRDKAELAQQIIIRLKTELGEFTYIPTLGSELVLERHNDINSELSIEQIKQYVKNAIADVELSNYEVNVERVDDESRYIYETLKIIIDSEELDGYTAII